MNENDLQMMKADIQELKDKVFGKPKSIISSHVLGKIIDKYDITASQASNIVYLVNQGDLNSEDEIKKYIEHKLKLIETVKENKNK